MFENKVIAREDKLKEVKKSNYDSVLYNETKSNWLAVENKKVNVVKSYSVNKAMQ